MLASLCVLPWILAVPVTGETVTHPDLGTIRYRDPTARRQLWFDLSGAGAYVPESFRLFDRDVWTAGVYLGWALNLRPGLSVGGRHGLVWYDAGSLRTRLHRHELSLSGQILGLDSVPSRLRDRLELGIEFHKVALSVIDGVGFRLGGVDDVVMRLGYGMEHPLGDRLFLGWNAQGRFVWLFNNTQRQGRVSLRLAWRPRPAHEIKAESVAFLVHRDPRQYGKPLPRTTLNGQFGVGYAWMSRLGLGPFVEARYYTGFLSGEAPVFEVREEALNAPYADVSVGVRASW
jgi:hypothetical protein